MNNERFIERKLKESVSFIRQTIRQRPRIGIVLGSGLGYFADSMASTQAMNTAAIPHYPTSTIEGHSGKFLIGKLHGKTLLVFQGRVHYYESGNIESILYPIRVARALGVRTLLVTNAAGGVNPGFKPADLMLITDHINLTFKNAIRGYMPHHHNTPVYDPALQALIADAAQSKGISLKRGVYCGVQGPSYETAAEVRMSKMIGADAVGMSTVNEASLAHALGMRVGGISCITNLSTGMTNQKLTHREVTEVARQVQHSFSTLLDAIIERLE
ncbi:MAG: purine-nucleoside phosphorylase [Ignavibacteriae bacterium]|nr:purine-nucleoside phosphorylase [Ignavibacteria bacterium]MBI3363677.1 purine-nucleoside phosphorylase [Ignavibacteriota bacterium]